MIKIFRRALAGTAAVWLMLGCAPAEEKKPADAEIEMERVETLELPPEEDGEIAILSVEEDPRIGPREENYLYREGYAYPVEKVDAPSGYADPSITVNIGWGRAYKTNFVYARVKIAQPAQLRILQGASVNSAGTVSGLTMAKRVNAVIAINGDYAAQQVKGTVVRQGETLRKNARGKADVLVIDDRGDLHVLPKAVEEDIEAFGEHAVNVLTFGPGLIIDGEPQYGYRSNAIATHKGAQRMAICQTGPLEYLLITSEAEEDPGSKGLTLDQFIEVIASFGDVQTAYNLDGGSCSTLAFRKNGNNWTKYNGPRNLKNRTLKDIIYFADAWIPDEKTEEIPADGENAGAEAAETEEVPEGEE